MVEIAEDPSDFKLVYDPTHPDANAEGYVEMPNVDLIKEMSDAMAANQALSANITAFNVLKQVVAKDWRSESKPVPQGMGRFCTDTRRRDEYECASNR